MAVSEKAARYGQDTAAGHKPVLLLDLQASCVSLYWLVRPPFGGETSIVCLYVVEVWYVACLFFYR